MDNIKTYITYFDKNQIEEYNLKENENTILFKGDDVSYTGESINYLNIFFCELCTMYYIWKNNLKSDYVVLKQYRRPFNWEEYGRLPEDGEVICYDSITLPVGTIMYQYSVCHGSRRAYDILHILKDVCGDKSDELHYFINGKIMYTNNSIVMKWDDFCKMCEFVFKVVGAIDKFYKLDYKYTNYKMNARKYTEDGRFDYQMHWMAYIGERLVSCYIATKMKPLPIPRLEGNGFYLPYQKK